MLFDCSTYIGSWPFRKIEIKTINQLASVLEENLTDAAVVTNLNAVFYRDPMEGNLELLEELKGYKGKVKFYPFAVINPSYVNWREDFAEYARLGFYGVEVAPGYHNYNLDLPEAHELYRLCGEYGLTFKAISGFENIRGRHIFDTFIEPTGDELASLFAESDKTATLVCAYYTFQLGEKIRSIAAERNNILFDISCLDDFNQSTLNDLISYAGEDKMCYATIFPFRYIAPTQLKLYTGSVSESGIGKISSENALRVIARGR